MAAYATQMDAAKQGILTPEMETVAKEEHLEPELIRQRVAKGTICIPANIHHKSLHPYGIGEGLRTKMNVNLGISGDCHDYTAEFEKVKLAIQFQCEAIMDLSNYGKTHTFRKQLIEMSPAMIGTVPMYDAIGYLEKDLADIKATDFLKVLERTCQRGCGFPDHSRRHQPPCGGSPQAAEAYHQYCFPRRLAAVRVDGDDRQRKPVLRIL